MFGLHGQDIELIIEAIKRFDEIDYAFIYGSRALGNYKKGSDVDVAITGQRTTPKTATK